MDENKKFAVGLFNLIIDATVDKPHQNYIISHLMACEFSVDNKELLDYMVEYYYRSEPQAHA